MLLKVHLDLEISKSRGSFNVNNKEFVLALLPSVPSDADSRFLFTPLDKARNGEDHY